MYLRPFNAARMASISSGPAPSLVRKAEAPFRSTRTANEVLDSGQPVRLRPMTPFERKVVHDAVAGIKGVVSESEGEEPRRQVVVSRSA